VQLLARDYTRLLKLDLVEPRDGDCIQAQVVQHEPESGLPLRVLWSAQLEIAFSLMKQKTKGKNCAVFCFAGKRFFFYIYDVITSPEKGKSPEYYY